MPGEEEYAERNRIPREEYIDRGQTLNRHGMRGNEFELMSLPSNELYERPNAESRLMRLPPDVIERLREQGQPRIEYVRTIDRDGIIRGNSGEVLGQVNLPPPGVTSYSYSYTPPASLGGVIRLESESGSICTGCRFRHSEGRKVCGQGQVIDERVADGACPFKEEGAAPKVELNPKNIWEYKVNGRIEQAPECLRELKHLLSTRKLKHYDYQRKFIRSKGKVQVRASLVYNGGIIDSIDVLSLFLGERRSCKSFELLHQSRGPFMKGCDWVVYKFVYEIAPGEERVSRRKASKRSSQDQTQPKSDDLRVRNESSTRTISGYLQELVSREGNIYYSVADPRL